MNLKKFLFLLIAIISINLNAFSQTVSQAFENAQSLYLQGEYSEAISDFRRVLYFKNNDDPESCLMLGNCYRSLLEKEKALYYYRQAFDKFESDSMRLEMKFNIISLYLIVNEPNYALTQVFSLSDSLNPNDDIRVNFYFSLAYYQLKEFALSQDYFHKVFVDADSKTHSVIDSIFRLAEKNNNFNVYIPMILSIIPGLGQFYLGEYEAALNSFLLTTGLAGLYLIALVNLPIIDAVLTVLPWFQRYYQGGLLQAKALAVKKKENSNNEYYNGLIDIYSRR